MNTQLTELTRLLRNLIRTGVITQVDTANGMCRVATGNLETDWLHWLTARAGNTRTWWAPSVGEQVLLLSIGGELTTAFVLPAIFSNDFPAPSTSPEATHTVFPDGAVMEYEPQSSALTVTGIKTATVTASESVHVTAPEITCVANTRITLNTPEVICTQLLSTGNLIVREGGKMTGNIAHTGGIFSSNGVVVDLHTHTGVRAGKDTSGGPDVNNVENTVETKPVSEGDNTDESNITVPERAFIAKEYPIGHEKDPFEKGIFESEIYNRLSKITYPQQGWASLCGPAAFFYCLQIDRPDIYEQAARELWKYGKTKIGQLEINPGDGCRHPKGKFWDICKNDKGEEWECKTISGLDWITLASLRDSENMIFSYNEVDDAVAGITMWGKLTEWFEKAGYEKVFDNISLSHSNITDIMTLNDYIKKGYRVVSLVSHGMLGKKKDNFIAKTHWIVWEGEVSNSIGLSINSSNITNDDTIVNLNLFSWGKVERQIKQNKSLSYFLKRTFGALVFKPTK